MVMSDYRKLVEKQSKETVGYSEATNKKSFMTGVSVAISKAEYLYNKEIESLKLQLKYANKSSDDNSKDLQQLALIISKHLPQ